MVMLNSHDNRFAFALVAMATTLLAGCYPMEQAALVYSSKHQVGVHVTAGTTDAPGLDVVLGYKGLDVAMVPVAVAKHCKAEVASNCVDGNYDVAVITGGRAERTDNNDVESSIATLRATIDKDVEERAAVIKNLASIDTQLAQFRKRSELIDQIAQIEAQEQLAPDDQSEVLATLAAQKQEKQTELQALTSVASLDVDSMTKLRTSFETNGVRLDGALARARNQLNELLLQMRIETAGERKDALSVYGTFSSATKGDNTGGKLSAGKVFATGVAAQYLSEAAGAADCLAKLATLAEQIEDDAARSAFVLRTQEICVHKHKSG